VAKDENWSKALKAFFPNWAWPLTFFHIHGTMCCSKMLFEYKVKPFTDSLFCYEAKSIKEANTLVIWGSLSSKLIILLQEQMETMAKGRFVIHMRGGEHRVNNEYSSSSLASFLSINTECLRCAPSKLEYRKLIDEARQCLKA
jgi:hypothetical protein